MQINIFELLTEDRWVKKGENQWREVKCSCCNDWITIKQSSVQTIENKSIHSTCINKMPINQIQSQFRHLWKGHN